MHCTAHHRRHLDLHASTAASVADAAAWAQTPTQGGNVSPALIEKVITAVDDDSTPVMNSRADWLPTGCTAQ